MSGKSGTLALHKDSPMGALHLAYSGPGRVSKDDPFAPCKLYLEHLAEGGRRGQRVNLERAARILTNNPEASIADFDWRGLSFTDLETLRTRLRMEGYANSVINGTLSALKGVARRAWLLEQMNERQYALIQDVQGVSARHQVRPGRALTEHEIMELFRACDRASTTAAGARDAALLAIFYGGGLRCSEVRRLKLSDWNGRTHTLRVHGKGDRDRNVFFLDGGSRRAINQWLRRRGDKDGHLLCPATAQGIIHVGRALGVATIYKALARRGAAAGIAHFSAHDLRRSGATHLYEKTHDYDLVKEFLGHVHVNTTQLYVRGGEHTRKKAATKMKVPFRRPGAKRKGKRRGRRKSSWRAQLSSQLSNR